MKEIAWKDDMRSFQVEYMPVNNLIIKINEMLDKICHEFPEVDRNTINVLGESDTICMGDYDQGVTVLTFRFKRHMTPEEIDMLRWGKENERKRRIQLLQKLIKDNSDDAIKFLESNGYEVRHKNNPMKIDYSDSIRNMFCDECDTNM